MFHFSIKKTLSISYLLCSFFIFSQLHHSNSREGESIQYCLQHVKHAEMLQDYELSQQYQIDQQVLSMVEEQMKNNPQHTRGTVYKIPIVFHVLHNGGPENISREQILDGLRVMNRDWRKLNADTASVVQEFRSLISDIEVEFVLATKAPNGACFSGITRTQSPLSFVTSNNQGGQQVTAIVNGNDVYNGQWPGNKYLNIFVCGNIGGAAGYTTKPNSNWTGTSMGNGIWILHDYVGSIGTGSVGRDRTLTHEAGHWLNLSHTWGDTNDPGLASNCNTDDGIADTPNTRGVSACNLNENFCGPRANVENYMDYSYCSKMFTEGQKTRIRAALNSSVGGRNNHWTVANLQSTGADGNLSLCAANFRASKTLVCAGDQISFFDESFNVVSSWEWNFQGATNNTSTQQNPVVTYSMPGTYTVTLTVSDGTTSKTTTKTAFIKVLRIGMPIPINEGFELIENIANTNFWSVYNPQNNQTFEIVNGTSHSGSRSIKLNNFSQSAGSEDELIASPINLGQNTGTVTLSFRYSYRKKASANNERLQVFASKDCGESWAMLRNVSGSTLGSIVQTTAWTPTVIEDWSTIHVTNIFSPYFVENFRYKFKFTSDGGNNLYLDNINIYAGSPSEEIVAGDFDNDGIPDYLDPDIDGDGVPNEEDLDPFNPNVTTNSIKETKKSFQKEINLYPNPTDNDFVVEYYSKNYEQTKIEIINSLGKVVHTQIVKSNEGNNVVFMSPSELANGVYLVKTHLNGKENIKRLIIK
jgi:PKD repeat protein